MNQNFIEEGWVRFRRIPCKEGWIDVWRGDQSCDPNESQRPHYNLNTSVTYLRGNYSRWVCTRDMRIGGHYLLYLEMAPEFTADEIWKELTINLVL